LFLISSGRILTSRKDIKEGVMVVMIWEAMVKVLSNRDGLYRMQLSCTGDRRVSQKLIKMN
jgi:hypothetical protein